MRRTLFVIGMCLLATGALAQGTPGSIELTPTAGYWFGDSLTQGNHHDSGTGFRLDIDDDMAYGLRLGFRFTENWALEALLSYEDADLVTPSDDLFGGEKLGTMEMMTGELGFEVGFGHSRLVPFLAGGIGLMHFSPNMQGMSSDTRFSTNLGTGFKLFFTPQIALRFDWRGHWVNMGEDDWDDHDNCDDDWWYDCHYDTEWMTFTEIGLGLTFVF